MCLKRYFEQAPVQPTITHAQYTARGSVEPTDWHIFNNGTTGRVFIYERIHAIISEMLGAIEKAIADCEGQTAIFKEENSKIVCSANSRLVHLYMGPVTFTVFSSLIIGFIKSIDLLAFFFLQLSKILVIIAHAKSHRFSAIAAASVCSDLCSNLTGGGDRIYRRIILEEFMLFYLIKQN